MAETTQFVSRISVKDLISAFENKSETVRVEFSRPRARSFGNVLNKNVIVRLSEFVTLEDIEKGLTKLETDLNFYEVYNKAKHVAFQEQFFNILTSIANIENSEEDAPVRKKRLISRTQTLVSFLNQKLPTNINQVVESKPVDQYKYTPYASHIKANPKSEPNTLKPAEKQLSVDSNVQPTLYVESNSTVDVTDSGREYIVSVKKLKENFQHKAQTEVDGPPKQEKIVKVSQKVTVTKSIEKTERPKPEAKEAEVPSVEVNNTHVEEKVESVSVTKLRSLFEQGSSSKGLEVITVDKPQLTKNNFGGSAQNINSIPYTERNLGSIRLKRSVSGNYMNYSGLLKRVDINRSSSNIDVNRDNNRTVAIENNSDEDYESDNTLENEDESVRIEEISSAARDTEKPVENKIEKKRVNLIKDSEENQIKYPSKADKNESNNTNENVANGKAIFTSESDKGIGKENVSNLQGFEEEEVNYSKASTEEVDEDENYKTTETLTFKGVDEVEVNRGVADSKNVLEEENIATLELAEDPQSISTTENFEGVEDNKTVENELSFKGYDEEEVNQGTASSESVQIEENVAKLEATTEDASESIFISEVETNNGQSADNSNKSESDESHATQETDDEVIEESQNHNSTFSSLVDLEDERERSLIEEVIEKIDVEQTLANADLVVNPEDLKNADDEFEKLLENSQSGK